MALLATAEEAVALLQPRSRVYGRWYPATPVSARLAARLAARVESLRRDLDDLMALDDGDDSPSPPFANPRRRRRQGW